MVAVTDDEIEAALERAKAFEGNDRRARKAEYKAVQDRVAVYFKGGMYVSIPRRQLQGLQRATVAQLSKITLIGNGTGLHWPDLDVDHYVLELLAGSYGTKHWMSELGRRGGRSRSSAKAQASRLNGRLGGRPTGSMRSSK